LQLFKNQYFAQKSRKIISLDISLDRHKRDMRATTRG